MPFIQLTRIERKRFIVLLCCLFCAIVAWLLMALNRKYVYTAKTVLIYKHFPQNKAFKALQSDTVDLQVEGTGWQLLFARLRVNPQSISVSLEKLNRRNYVLFTEQLSQVNKQLETSQKIISVKPDTLFFDFSRRTNKRVPLRLRSDFSFAKQYEVSGQIELKPAYVNISGPHEELARIREWYTDTLRLTDLHKTTQTKVAIRPNSKVNVSIYPLSVGVKIPVDEFTEKTLEIPVNILNNKNYDDVKIYPKKVKITFMVALSRYKEVDEDFIVANVDLNEWKQLKHEKLHVMISRFPEYCKLVQLSPEKVDFIIEK